MCPPCLTVKGGSDRGMEVATIRWAMNDSLDNRKAHLYHLLGALTLNHFSTQITGKWCEALKNDQSLKQEGDSEKLVSWCLSDIKIKNHIFEKRPAAQTSHTENLYKDTEKISAPALRYRLKAKNKQTDKTLFPQMMKTICSHQETRNSLKCLEMEARKLS
jgi:hypothetical protein